MITATENPQGNKNANHSAMTCHSAFPDGENFKRSFQVIIEFIKQNIPQSTAEQHSAKNGEKEILLLRVVQFQPSARVFMFKEPSGEDKSRQISDTVPTDALYRP